MTKIIELKPVFRMPVSNTSEPISSQRIVALRGELKQLTTDLNAIASGQAGSTFAKGVQAKLTSRISALATTLRALDADGSAAR